MYRKILCFALTALAGLTGTANAATLDLTLKDLIGLSLKGNPQIEIARQQLAGTEGVLTQARSRYLPHLATGADLARIHVKDLQPVDEDNMVHGLLQVSQLIYDFGRTTGLINTSAFNVGASDENFRQVIQDVVYQVKSGYYTVLEKQQLIFVAERAVENYTQQLYRAKKYYEAGVRTRIDVTNAEVNLSNQRLNLLRAKANLKAARVQLETIIGQKPNSGDYRLVSDALPLESLATAKPSIPDSLDNLLAKAREERPGLKRFAHLINAADSAVNQAEGDYWPRLNAFGSYNAYETDLSSLVDQWQVGVGLNWEFFSGFETEGKVAEARAKLREVKANLREYELAVVKDVTDSFLRAEENLEGVDIASESLVLATENLRLADGRYKTGIGDILEYNDAQLLYISNQSDLVATYYTYLTDLARLERATGTIKELHDADLSIKAVEQP